jgi:Ca-activated chloride channel family protein
LQEEAEGGDQEEPDTEGEGEQPEQDDASAGGEEQDEREEAGGEEVDMDEDQASSDGAEEQIAQGETKPDFSPQSDTAPEAVERFDQLGQEADEQGSEESPETLADASGVTGESEGIPMMEQWLEQVEGDPTYLLQNQFMLEEHQLMQRRGGRLIETRPW